MGWLVVVSLVWGLSFGLIKGRLTGLDAAFIAAVRLALATLVFLPFLRLGGLTRTALARLAAVGAVQFGLMYALYNLSFAHLAAWQVALFTVTTPIWVIAIHDVHSRRFTAVPVALAAVSVLGAAMLQYRAVDGGATWTGFLLVQASNACFAWGQVEYRRFRAVHDVNDRAVHGLLYAAGALVAVVAAGLTGGVESAQKVTAESALTLGYLGVVASGLCFFAWNRGATRVSAGSLAVVNNLKVPSAVLCSLVVFGESADLVRLALGGGVMVAATIMSQQWTQRRT